MKGTNKKENVLVTNEDETGVSVLISYKKIKKFCYLNKKYYFCTSINQ